MKLSVATNWDDRLFDALAPFPVVELFGSMANTPSGGGRAAFLLKKIDFDTLANYVAKTRDRGWRFNYLLNSTCTGGRESESEFRQKLLAYLKTLSDMGVECVTAANPFMIEFIKRHVPAFTVKSSIFLDIDGVAKARFLESLGVDNIKVSINSNRNFAFLRELRKAVTCDLTLLVNQACLYQCPYSYFHGNINAHASIDEKPIDGPLSTYCMLKCTLLKLRDPAQLVRSRWIRPEDLEYYEEIGYDTFKIAGREATTDRIVRTVAAYANRRCDGNLLDILNGVTLLEALPARTGIPAIKLPVLDDRCLDGFLRFWIEGKCKGRCSTCDYCENIAKQCASTFLQENVPVIELLEYYGSSLIDCSGD